MAKACKTNSSADYLKHPRKIAPAPSRPKRGPGDESAPSTSKKARKEEDAILAELDKGPLGA